LHAHREIGFHWRAHIEMTTRVFIVAEIRLYREGLERSLAGFGYETAGTAASTAEALEALREPDADVVLVDMAGLEATGVARAIAERSPGTTIVALAVPEEESHVMACAEAGVSSYVPREASLTDLAAAIEAAARGEAVCSPKITASLFRRVRTLSSQRPEPADVPMLTSRQWEIIDLIDQGPRTRRSLAGSTSRFRRSRTTSTTSSTGCRSAGVLRPQRACAGCARSGGGTRSSHRSNPDLAAHSRPAARR
jgi:DNA-binding NarL/FixJ family response regulator